MDDVKVWATCGRCPGECDSVSPWRAESIFCRCKVVSTGKISKTVARRSDPTSEVERTCSAEEPLENT